MAEAEIAGATTEKPTRRAGAATSTERTTRGAAKGDTASSKGRPRLVSLLEWDTGPKRVLVVDGPGLYVG